VNPASPEIRRVPRIWPYAGAWALTTLLGLGDEGIQHLLPERYFVWTDVGLNALAAALALGVVVVGRRQRI